ncbi:MAG: SLC13 family permease [Acidiferrobacter sp.]
MWPEIPNHHALFVLILTGSALLLFSSERVPLETSALGVLAALVLVFALVPFAPHHHPFLAIRLFYGFSNPALIAVVALMAIGAGVVNTGALEPVGRVLARLWPMSPRLALLVMLVIAAFLSAFVNNTPIVILLLPLLTGIAARAQESSSRLLMPMGFATLIGGMGTTIGTSTNLLVIGLSHQLGVAPMGMFSFSAIAAEASVVGIAYLWLVMPALLPRNTQALRSGSPRAFSARLKLSDTSQMNGKTLAEARALLTSARLTGVFRGDGVALALLPDLRMRKGDVLVVHDKPERLKEHEAALGAVLSPGESHDVTDNAKADRQLAEVVVTPTSRLAGSTLGESFFEVRYGLVPVGLYRRGKTYSGAQELDEVVLSAGDVVLVDGARTHLDEIRRKGRLLLLDATTNLPRGHKAPYALVIVSLVVTLAATGVLPIAISAVVGVLAMLATGCLTWADFSDAMRADVILIIVASLALSLALNVTGGASYLAAILQTLGHGLQPALMIGLLLLLTGIIANMASHVVAAVIGAPVAIDLAHSLHIAPAPFVLAVLFGANLCFATPMAVQTNLLVMSAGGYHFRDFMRAGIPLAVVLAITLTLLLSVHYRLPW